jgi:hypothetical protein
MEGKNPLFEYDPDTKPKGGYYPNAQMPQVIGNQNQQEVLLGGAGLNMQFEEEKKNDNTLINRSGSMPQQMFEYKSSDDKPKL